MQNSASIVIDRPIEQVFDLTNHHVAEWSITVVEDELIEDKNNCGLGTRFRIVTEEKGNRMEFESEVTRWEPPHISEVHLEGTMFNIDAEYVFEDLGGKTRVTQNSRVQGKGLMKIMFFVMGPFMKKQSCDATANELQSLKAYCEKQLVMA
ncbi:MAG: SRPBCC family protein [Planctomycetota bacterium]